MILSVIERSRDFTERREEKREEREERKIYLFDMIFI